MDFASGDYGRYEKLWPEISTHVLQETKPPDRPLRYVMWHWSTVRRNAKCMFVAPQAGGEQKN